MKWQKKLTKKQLKHIKETTDSSTLTQLKTNREFHLKMKKEHGHEICWDCREIAVKLGIET